MWLFLPCPQFSGLEHTGLAAVSSAAEYYKIDNSVRGFSRLQIACLIGSVSGSDIQYNQLSSLHPSLFNFNSNLEIL